MRFLVKSQTFLIQRAISKYFIIMLIFLVGVHRYTAERPHNKQYFISARLYFLSFYHITVNDTDRHTTHKSLN